MLEQSVCMCACVRALPKFNMRSLKKRKTKYTYKRERETEKRERTKRRGSIACPLFLCGWRKNREREKLSPLCKEVGIERERLRREKFSPASVSRANEHSLPLFLSLFLSSLSLVSLSPLPPFLAQLPTFKGEFSILA